MIRYHPPVRQIYVFLKLDGDHFVIGLYHDPGEPISGTFPFRIFMIAKYFHAIADIIGLILVGRVRKTQFSQLGFP